MKKFKHLLFILISFFSLSIQAQTNKKTLNYQAVILDPKAIDIPGASISGQPLNKGNVCLRFSLLNATGGLDYEETQQVTTDEFGLVNVSIGTGSQINTSGIYKSFETIVWNANVKNLKVSVSYDACVSFKQVSTQALNYTPYALYAEAVDYKNVREAPTNLSQFNNDAGYLIPKDLEPLKSDIKSNTNQIQTANQSIADNKLASDAAFLVVNQSLSSLDKQVADNTSSITTMNSRINDQQNQIFDNRNQLGGLQGQLNQTNSTVSNLTGVAEVVSNKSTSTNLGGANTSDQLYPTQKATKTYVDQAVAQVTSGSISDATTLAAGKIQLAGDLSGTATSPTVPALAGKENTSNKSTATDLGAGSPSDQLYPSQRATKAYVDNTIYAAVGAGVADATTMAAGKVKLAGDLAGTAASPTVPGLLLKEDLSNKSNGALGTSTTLYPTQNAVKTYVDTQVASATIVDADASTKGKIQLTGDLGGTASSPTVPGLTAKANLASPTFTGTVTSPIYASAPQNLTDAATISWNPANGLNANVTLGGNRTLSFSSTPTSGSYGTLVVTQDGTGGRTLTLPSGTNKVLGSASTTTIPLSSAANAKDILNFYYDGLTSTYFWNVGQGYGTAATAATVNLASGITGTLPIANGGTGATTAGAALTALGAQALANLSTDISGDAASLTKYPAVKTVRDYVDATVTSGAPDATTSVKGKIQLAGDLAGTAASPSVIKLRGTPISSVAPTTAGHVLTYDVNGNATWAAPANSANTISGVVPVANGGTGLSSVTSGGAVYASSSSALTTGTLPLTAGGTGATTATNAFNALSPMTTAGDIIYGGTNGAATRLGIGANATVLQVANGIPSWASISTGDLKFVYSNNNIGIGTPTTLANATQGDNVAIGRNALGSYYTGGISGSMNIGIGTDAGDYNSSGANNVYVGASAGITNQTGSNNTFMGYNTATSANRSVRNSISNSTAIGANAVVTTSNSIQLGDASVTNVKTSGTVTAGDITYPKTHGTANQVLTTTGSGTLTFTTPVVAKPTSDQFTATAAQTSFTLTQTPITNTTVSPNVKPNVWMYINGVRTNNNAYTISGTTVTYTAASNNSYTIVVGDRIQFDYAY